MVQNSFLAVFTHSAKVKMISKDPNFDCSKLFQVTAPSCFKLNSPMLGQPVWRDVQETLRGLSKKFGQDGQLETGSDDLK